MVPPPTEVDLERGESDLGEAFTPQILAGYYTPFDAPTEVGGFSGWIWVLQILVKKTLLEVCGTVDG